MRTSKTSLAALFLFALVSLPIVGSAQGQRPIDELFEGALLICGGGGVSKTIKDRFVRLAGGDEAHLVVIPTANAKAGEDQARFAKFFAGYEVKSVTVLHTTDRAVADTDEFVAPLKKATGVWFWGGQQSRIARAYGGTEVGKAVLDVVRRRRGVVGGTSAGAAIQTKVMIAGGRGDAPKMATGFDLLPGCVVDQHFTKRKRQSRLVAAVKANPTLVGLGIDEKTALWVQGRRVRIIGDGSVTVVMAPNKHRELRVSVHARTRVGLDLVTLRRAALLRGFERDHAFEPGKLSVPHGALILVGGGRVGRDLWRRFIELAGGKDAPIVVIPTAAGSARGSQRMVRMFAGMGVANVTVLHETDKAKVNSEAFLKPLREAKGIWFGGGRQWRLVDAYEGTEALPLFFDVLKRGGVIAGSSAGCSIQGEFMVRGNPLGNREIFLEGYERGFGFFPGAGIDQHFTQRGRKPDLEKLMRGYPKVLGIGVDEGTAIVVQKQAFEVMGPGQVLVCADGNWSTLRRGDVFDLAAKKPVVKKSAVKKPAAKKPR